MGGLRPRSLDLGVRPGAVEYAPISANTTGDTEIIGAVEGYSILVVGILIVVAGNVTVKFRSNTTDITGPMAFAANGGCRADTEWGLFKTAVGEKLNINLSGNQTVGGCITYMKVQE